MSQNNWQRLHNEDGDEEFANLESQHQQPQQPQQQALPSQQPQQSQQPQYNYPQKSKIRRPGAVSKPVGSDEENPLFSDPQWEKIVLGVLTGTLFIVIMILVVSVIKPHQSNADLRRDPEQIHLSLGDNVTSMFIVWATPSHHSKTHLRYGTDKNYIVYYTDGWTDYYQTGNYTSPLFHYVQVTGLSAYTTYYYQVGDRDENVWSDVYSFKTPSEYSIPFTAVAVANLEQSTVSNQVLQLINNTIRPNLALLIGDLSYAQGEQQRWDEWGIWFQNYSVSLPWMFVPGNIENERSIEFISYETRFPVSPGLQPPDNSTFGNRTKPVIRFRNLPMSPETQLRHSNNKINLRMRVSLKDEDEDKTEKDTGTTSAVAGTTSTGAGTTAATTSTFDDNSTTGEDNNNVTKKEKYHYHSFNYSYVHFIQLSSELTPARNTSQFLWLSEDLRKVDRQQTPWIIVSWHTPWYSSNEIALGYQNWTEKMRHTYERILYNHDVDICLSGHVHGYERTNRIWHNATNSTGIYYFSVGTGGSVEGLDTQWIEPAPEWSAFRSATYGTSTFHVHNETHIHWQYFGIENGTLIDDFWVVKRKTNFKTKGFF